jgi:membrane protein insertase Oxa1/YidC/SpoIIIJ
MIQPLLFKKFRNPILITAWKYQNGLKFKHSVFSPPFMNRSISQWTKRVPLQVQNSTQYQRHKPIISLSLAHDHQKRQENNNSRPFLLSTIAATGLTTTVDPTITTSVSETTLPAILALNESVLMTIHDAGLPWWATILAGTLALRSTLTLPIAIYQQRSMGKMINLAPMVQSWAETLKVQVAKESNQKGWSYKQYQAELQKQYKTKVKSIYAHHGCSRWKLLLLPWVQMPLFISMSLTLRHMAAYPLPWYGQTAELPVAGLSEGGLAWFMDLTAVDPTMIVPVMIGAGNLINVEVGYI